MARTIHADLLAEQKKTAYVPSLSLSIQDNGLPHPAVALAHPMTGYGGGATASVVAGTFILRARYTGGVVQVQKITDPTVSAQWTTGWTTLASGANCPALFYTGTYVVAVYQITASKAVCWRRSTNGTTWTDQQTIWTPAYDLGTLVVGASGGATRSGLFYATGTTLYFRLYDPAADTFAGSPTSRDYAAAVTSFGACFDTGNVYRLALALGSAAIPYDARNVYVLATGLYTYGGAYSAPYIHVGLPTTLSGSIDYRSLTNFAPACVNLAKVGTAFWLTFRVVNGSGCVLANDIRIAVSDDGTYYSGSVKLGQPNIADRLQPLYWAATGATYLASDSVLLISTPQSTLPTTQAAILRYEIDEGGPEARLEVVLDNRAGTFDGVETNRLGNDMVLARGSVCGATPTARTVAREPFVIEDVQWSRDNKRVRLTGHNYAALMRYWRADLNYYWRSQSVQTLVQAIAALGGVQAVTFDASAAWSTVLPDFNLEPGTSALEAIQALQQEFQFVYRVSSSGAMSCFALSNAPAANYVFGTATNEHPTLRARDSSKRRLPEITHTVVLGQDEHAGESLLPVQSEAGFQRTRIVTRQYLTTTAECAAQALALATKAEAVESQAIVYCLPAFHVELWDSAQSDGWAADQVRYVTNVVETFNTERGEDTRRGALAMPWYQVLTLADVDVTLAATGHGLPAPTALSHTYAEDGHHLAWFYPGRLSDVVAFEVVRNTDDAIDGNETLVYRGRNLQAIAAYSETLGDYFGVRAVGTGSLASSWLWGGPYIARQVTMQDDFRRYIRPDLNDQASLCALQLADYETDEAWSGGTADTTHVKEGARGLLIGSGDSSELTISLNMAQEQRFTDADFVGVDAYATGAVTEATLYFKKSEIPLANYYFGWALAAGWNHVKAKRGDAGIGGSPDWAAITKLTLELTDSGADATFDHLWISKADPDDATTYNDTGKVWDFLPLQGGGAADWHILPGKKTGMPNHDYVMAQLRAATTPAAWLLAWHTESDIAAGEAVTGVWLRAEGQAALCFCIQDATVATRTMYAVEVDTAANLVRLARWVSGTRTEIATHAFTCAPGEELWLAADFHDASRINVYAAKSASNLVSGVNLLISAIDANILRGGFVGFAAFDCVAYFFKVRGGSPYRAHFAESAALAERALLADVATDADTLGGASLSTDSALGTSDTLVPTQHAVKDYVDGRWVWLATPAISTDWDGDAKSGASGTLDLSALFSLPAGIKAVHAVFKFWDETVGVYAGLGPGSTYFYSLYQVTQVANVAVAVAGMVPCDANGDIYFKQSGELDGVEIYIYAYAV